MPAPRTSPTTNTSSVLRPMTRRSSGACGVSWAASAVTVMARAVPTPADELSGALTLLDRQRLQLVAQDLAGGAAGQVLLAQELHVARALVARQPLAAPVRQLAGRGLGARRQHDGGLDRLAPVRVGHAEHAHLGDG